jgi:hypothetical protein
MPTSRKPVLLARTPYGKDDKRQLQHRETPSYSALIAEYCSPIPCWRRWHWERISTRYGRPRGQGAEAREPHIGGSARSILAPSWLSVMPDGETEFPGSRILLRPGDLTVRGRLHRDVPAWPSAGCGPLDDRGMASISGRPRDSDRGQRRHRNRPGRSSRCLPSAL